MCRQMFLGVILLTALLVGCQTPTPVSSSSTMSLDTILDVEIWASRGCVQPGDTVHLRATVRNRGAKKQVIDLKDKPVLDMVFGNPDTGRRWSEDRPLTPDLTRLELQPGESKSIAMDWVTSQRTYGPNHVTALFVWNAKLSRLTPGVTVHVGTCPGVLP